VALYVNTWEMVGSNQIRAVGRVPRKRSSRAAVPFF
jgi:hypothetical protein